MTTNFESNILFWYGFVWYTYESTWAAQYFIAQILLKQTSQLYHEFPMMHSINLSKQEVVAAGEKV